jgi:hypothetical protein
MLTVAAPAEEGAFLSSLTTKTSYSIAVDVLPLTEPLPIAENAVVEPVPGVLGSKFELNPLVELRQVTFET